MPGSPLAGLQPDDVLLCGRHDCRQGRATPRRVGRRRHAERRRDRIEHERSAEFQDDSKHARNTHSAIFAEVKVDEQLGVIRVTRVVNAVAAGRIINTKTAANQVMGGVVWGIGMALHEETLVDHRFGRVMNANIAEYHVPVNADVQDIKMIFVDEPDDIINPMGIKGVGEIGIVGVAAAIANAVYHATGKRVRDLPITLDKLDRFFKRPQSAGNLARSGRVRQLRNSGQMLLYVAEHRNKTAVTQSLMRERAVLELCDHAQHIVGSFLLDEVNRALSVEELVRRATTRYLLLADHRVPTARRRASQAAKEDLDGWGGGSTRPARHRDTVSGDVLRNSATSRCLLDFGCSAFGLVP